MTQTIINEAIPVSKHDAMFASVELNYEDDGELCFAAPRKPARKPVVVSDPTLTAWIAEGAPSHGCTFNSDYSECGEASEREDYIGL